MRSVAAAFLLLALLPSASASLLPSDVGSPLGPESEVAAGRGFVDSRCAVFEGWYPLVWDTGIYQGSCVYSFQGILPKHEGWTGYFIPVGAFFAEIGGDIGPVLPSSAAL